MLNSGKKFSALRNKKINILTLVSSEKKFLNETKNHNPSFKLNGRSLNYAQNKIYIMILGRKPFLSAVKNIKFWNFMKCFMKRVRNILTNWCLNKFLKFILITILDAQMTLKMLIVGPRIIKIRSYHQLILFETPFHNVFDQITQRLPLKVI